MNRRNFLGLLAAAPVAALAFDPHRVIFDMGRKLWKPSDGELLIPQYHYEIGPFSGKPFAVYGPDGGLPIDRMVWQMNADQEMAWRNIGITVHELNPKL